MPVGRWNSGSTFRPVLPKTYGVQAIQLNPKASVKKLSTGNRRTNPRMNSTASSEQDSQAVFRLFVDVKKSISRGRAGHCRSLADAGTAGATDAQRSAR